MNSILGISAPTHWRTSPLKHLAVSVNRGTAPEYVDDGPVRMISQASNQLVGLDWSKTRFHNFSGDPSRLKGFLEPGDVLVNSTGTGTLGRVGQYFQSVDDRPCVADGHVTVVRPEVNNLDPRYCFHWLSSRPFQEYLYAALVVGATNQIELNRDRLRDAPVPVPPLDEQRRIADFLDAETSRIDQVIALRVKQVDMTLGRLKAAASEFTGRVGLHDPTRPRTSHVQLRRALRTTQTGATPQGLLRTDAAQIATMPWYTPAAIDDLLSIRGTDISVDALRVDVPVFSAGSIVITGIGESLGKVGYLRHRATGNQQLTALKPNSTVSGRFIAWQLWAAQDEIREWAQYSRVRIINNDVLKSFPISLPSLEKQHEVAASLDAQSNHALHLRRLVAQFQVKIAERRQALITAAVTGQFDVTTASGRNVTEGVTV